MALFKKDKKDTAQAAKRPSGQSAGGKVTGFLKGRQQPNVNILSNVNMGKPGTPGAAKGARKAPEDLKPTRWRLYVQSIGLKRKGLEQSLRIGGFKESLYEFVQRMLITSLMIAAMMSVFLFILLSKAGLTLLESLLFAVVIGFACFQVFFNMFLSFPAQKSKNAAKMVERDILFAARDMIISLRSGMPLFNAIASVSTGYGQASRQFARIVERVQLGTPLEQAIDQQIDESGSISFRRLMLQASVSIKAGADVIAALQSIIDQLSQERVIALRRYGQRLNALAMFYMLFGVILPSMFVAVAIILTTFISIITIDDTVLFFIIVFIAFIQLIFLEMIRSSRPSFSM
jgi:flagellar protein FlaJ